MMRYTHQEKTVFVTFAEIVRVLGHPTKVVKDAYPNGYAEWIVDKSLYTTDESEEVKVRLSCHLTQKAIEDQVHWIVRATCCTQKEFYKIIHKLYQFKTAKELVTILT